MSSEATTSDAPVSAVKVLYGELRHEIEVLAKALPGPADAPTRFPDPVALSAIERRVLVRAIFSFVDALTYAMKSFALEVGNASRLSHGERTLAREEAYELGASGEVEKRRAKLRTLSNVRFAFGLLAKVGDVAFRLDVSREGWQAIQKSLRVRDRLMHPKEPADLVVSDDEVRGALRAFIWFESQLVLILVAMVRSLETRVESLAKT